MRFLAMLMTFVLTVGCVGEVSYAAEPSSKQESILDTVSEGDLATVDISDNLLQDGGLLKEYVIEEQDGYGEEELPKYLAVDRDTYNSVEALLKSAYDVYSTECSLAQFQLTPEELKEIVAEVLNTNPRYFYVYGGYSYSSSGGYVTRILPRYDYAYEQAESMIQAYDAAVSQAVEGASKDWSDLEKALYINDYLTRNCEYDTTYTNYDAYDVFVSKTAVCQGYALAYLELANQLGLSAEIVTSTSLNHAWNMIEINGKYYQEDATWNDPVSDLLGRARHLYFMKSTEYYQTEVDHFEQDDWVVSGGLTWTDASSKDYDGYFWDDIDVGFEYIDGYWYGFDGVDRIVKYDCNGSAFQEVEELLQIDDVWRVTGSNSYYGSKYLGLGQFDGKLYYSNPYTIYHYNLNTKTMDEVYSLSETDKAVGSIYAMHIAPAGEVYYYLTPSLNTTGTIELATVLTKELKSFSITYELDGGENHIDNPASYTENDSFVFEMPTKENYVFDGWYTDSGYTDPIVGISAGTTGNLVIYAKWVEKVYDISFDGNGSTSGQMSDMLGCLFEQDYSLSRNTYERTGYVFTGWNTCADGSGVSYGDGASVRNLASIYGGTVTLYAQWEIEDYTITYHMNGGANDSANPTSYTVNDEFEFANPTREGYVFDGWYTEAEHTNHMPGISVGTTGNLVLYAKWIANAYGISFDGNGSTEGQMSDITGCLYNQEYTLSVNAFDRVGYIFTGWNTCADGSGVSYEDGASVRNLTTVNGEVVTLYAQWEAEEYTIIYYLNDGTNSSSNPSRYTINDAFVFASPIRENYVFGGWYTDAECTNPITGISAGTTGDQEVYAKWVTNAYRISFDGNGSTDGQMTNMECCLFDQDYTLPVNVYERGGHVFNGWNTRADGSGVFYEDGASVNNLTTVNGETVVLYAQWEAQEYTLTYELNGGTNSSANPASYTVNDDIEFANPTRENYTFDGWYTDEDYTNPITEINIGTTGNLRLYAKWITNVYIISFDGNGATGGSMNSLSNRKYGVSYTLTANAYKRTGYTFAGWNTKVDGTGKTYKNQENVKNLTNVNGKTITLYAQWTPIKYTIKFNGSGATGGSMNGLSNRNYGTSYKLTANAYKRTGYIFAGWNTNAKGTGTAYKNQESVKNLTNVNGKTITLYAQWTPIKYTIKFNANGATGGKMSNLSNRKYGSSYKLTKNAYKRTGYTFAGWNTKAKGTGKSYKNQESVKDLANVNGKTITLYAQWTPIKYTIKFNGNGATSGKMSSLTNRKYGTGYTLTKNAYKKKGYTFGGWNTKKNGKGKSYKNRASVKNLTSSNGKTITLYAQWKKLKK